MNKIDKDCEFPLHSTQKIQIDRSCKKEQTVNIEENVNFHH